MFQIPLTSSGLEELKCLILIFLCGHSITNMNEYPLLQPLFKLASEDVFQGKYAAWVFALVLGCLQLILKLLSGLALTLPLVLFTALGTDVSVNNAVSRIIGAVYGFICVGFFFDS